MFIPIVDTSTPCVFEAGDGSARCPFQMVRRNRRHNTTPSGSNHEHQTPEHGRELHGESCI
jgi:hypothetical protein